MIDLEGLSVEYWNLYIQIRQLQTLRLETERGFWRTVRRENFALYRALQDQLNGMRNMWIKSEPSVEPLKTEGLCCLDCGVVLPDRATGRPRQRCPTCLKKQRADYQHELYKGRCVIIHRYIEEETQVSP